MIQGMTEAELTGSISDNFIVQMIPHHRAAIEMSGNILKYTTSIPLQEIALGIISGADEKYWKYAADSMPVRQVRKQRAGVVPLPESGKSNYAEDVLRYGKRPGHKSGELWFYVGNDSPSSGRCGNVEKCPSIPYLSGASADSWSNHHISGAGNKADVPFASVYGLLIKWIKGVGHWDALPEKEKSQWLFFW